MGIEVERFTEKVNDELICSICCDVLENPVECSTCQKNFCEECIEMWMKKSHECPNRCEFRAQKSHRFIRISLDNLEIHCKARPNGCDQVLKLEFLAQHEEKECKFRLVRCENEGCEQKLILMDLETHRSECEFRKVNCLDCGHSYPISQAHSCLEILAEYLSELQQQIRANNTTLMGLESSLRSRGVDNYLNTHTGVRCSGCSEENIKGVRYICLECPDFSLCWNCKTNTAHLHTAFVQLLAPGYHEGITCDGCGIQNIPNIRFKCYTCQDFDFCWDCKHKKEHEHKEFFAWAPYFVRVCAVKPKTIKVEPGRNIVREWEVQNLGLEPIVNPMLILCDGNPCSIYYAVEKRQVLVYADIPPRTIRIVRVEERVVDFQPGYYKAKWRLASPTRMFYFGPKLKYELII